MPGESDQIGSGELRDILLEVAETLEAVIIALQAERDGGEVGDNLARAGGFVSRARRPAHEDCLAARRVLRRHRVERPFDADGADVREEGVARRRTGLQRGADELLVEVEHRRKVGLEERRAERVQTGRRLEADDHLAGADLTRLAAVHGAGPLTAADRCVLTAAAFPIEELEPLAVQAHFETLAGNRPETGRRHVVAENRRHRDRVFTV